MPNGFGWGRGFGRGFRGGMGFGFRGASPPWPYVGIGRGGLPRCGYFLSDAGVPASWPYPQTPLYEAPPAYGYGPPAAPVTREEELDYLKDQAEAIRGQLDQTESRMRDLEVEQ
jgi:hypothetical protein